MVSRDWLPKFATGLIFWNRHRSKSIWVTILSFCQIDPLMSESFWQKDRMVTHILFDLCLFTHFSPVANFGYQSLGAHIYWPRVYLLSNKKRNVIMLAPSNYLKVHSQENGILSLTLDDQAWAKTQHSSCRQFNMHEFLGHSMDKGFILQKLN